MAKVNVAELPKEALDFAVSIIEGEKITIEINKHGHKFLFRNKDWPAGDREIYSPSSLWEQGGPIIERERILVCPRTSEWGAVTLSDVNGFGKDPLTAAMRCFVSSKLGKEVDIPDELM